MDREELWIAPRGALPLAWQSGILSQRWTACLIAGIGLVIRLVLLVPLTHQPLAGDSASYNNMALGLLRGGALTPYWPPGLPLFLSLVHWMFGPTEAVARLAMLVFYLGCAFFTYRSAVLLTGETAAGNLALVVLAISPASILASVETMTELPTAMCLMVVGYCLLRAESGFSLAYASLLGILIGYLSLIRPSSVLLLVLVPAYLWWRTRKPAAPVIVLLLGTLVVSLWTGFVYEKTGFIRINTSNSRNLYYGNNPRTPIYKTWWLGSHHELANTSTPPENAVDAVAQEAQYSKLAAAYIRQHPYLFLVRTFNRVCVYFSLNVFAGSYLIANYGIPKLLGLVILALDAGIYLMVAAGTILYVGTLSGMTLRTRNVCVLLGLIAFYALPYFVAFSHPRLHYPMEPLLIVLFSAFVTSCTSARSKGLWETLHARKLPVASALLVFLLIQVEFLALMAGRL